MTDLGVIWCELVRKTLLITMMLLALPLSAGPAAAEDPHNQDCDGIATLRALCAGADAGGNAGCDNTNQAEITCWYTYSWNINASSPLPLPSGAHLAWNYQIIWCTTGGECTPVEGGGGGMNCTWLINELEPCSEFHTDSDELHFVLELGQCVEVHVTAQASSQAWALDPDDPLFHAQTESTGTGAGAACYLDDGRD